MTNFGGKSARPPLKGVHGRRKAKKLRALHARLLTDLLPRLKIDPFHPLVSTNENGPARAKAVWLEIGFGGGEHLVAQSTANPDVNFIGCEPFINGVAKLLSEIDDLKLRNVRIHPDDAVEVLKNLPTGSIDRVYILFPDPWPKRRQRKRRFINKENLLEIARVMKKGAELRFATDVDDYSGWTLAQISEFREFKWKAQRSADWKEPWFGHCETRYEKRAILHGNSRAYLTFLRTDNDCR